MHFTVDNSDLSYLLEKARHKKVYRELANDVLADLKDYAESFTHIDTGEMVASWVATPLKMRDSEYHVFGELYNESDHAHWEALRGGDHDALGLALEYSEAMIGDSIENALEALLK